MSDDKKEEKKDFADEAKETAKEFTDAAKETFADPGSKKILAGVLGIILGAFGVHKFVLGYTKEGIIMLVITVVLGIFTFGILSWVMGVIGLIEGIVYLTKSDEEFHNTYQASKRPWF